MAWARAETEAGFLGGETNERHARLQQVVTAAEHDRWFTAWALYRHRRRWKISRVEQATWLRLTPEALLLLAMCRRPVGRSTMFSRDLGLLEECFGCSADRLTTMLAVSDPAARPVTQPRAAPPSMGTQATRQVRVEPVCPSCGMSLNRSDVRHTCPPRRQETKQQVAPLTRCPICRRSSSVPSNDPYCSPQCRDVSRLTDGLAPSDENVRITTRGGGSIHAVQGGRADGNRRRR